MIRPPAPAVAAPTEGSAEEAILMLLYVLIGDGGNTDKGLMSHIVDGEQHIERCQRGMWITPDLRGDPCSTRCLRAQRAREVATAWLYAQRPPAQMTLDEVAG